jgi:hypothetical protein
MLGHDYKMVVGCDGQDGKKHQLGIPFARVNQSDHKIDKSIHRSLNDEQR